MPGVPKQDRVTDEQVVEAVLAVRREHGVCSYHLLAQQLGVGMRTAWRHVRRLAEQDVLRVGTEGGSIRLALGEASAFHFEGTIHFDPLHGMRVEIERFQVLEDAR